MEVMYHRYRGFVTISACWLFHFLITLTAIYHSKAYTWFEAQTICREKNQSLTLWKNESTSFYWTGFYKKRSYWIKIIDCYNATEIQNSNRKFLELPISSPPLCQEHCLQQNIYLFAVQAKNCICLSDGFDYSKNKLESSYCTYMCNDTTLLSTECGGESAFNVFLTDTTDLNVNTRCLSIECSRVPIFNDFPCEIFLLSICSNLADDLIYGTWREKKDYCKSTGTYPVGNLTLSNSTIACIESTHKTTTPRWVGVVKELFQTQDQGQLISNHDQTFIASCMKCRVNDTTQEPQCLYELCSDNSMSKVYCSKDESIGSYIETTAIEIASTSVTTSTLSFESEITRSIESSEIQIVVPVVLVLLFISGLISAVVVYFRKKWSQEKDSKVDRNPSSNDSRMYSNVQPHNSDNYCKLQQPYSTSGLTDYSQLQFSSQPNYGDSNHLENGAEQPKTSDYININ